ncbi:MAG: mechanosensitive ion channel [Verrucomicrobia bacterium]|nr:mechanosensitive ion channel [Verrucomicrobiota bacterium]
MRKGFLILCWFCLHATAWAQTVTSSPTPTPTPVEPAQLQAVVPRIHVYWLEALGRSFARSLDAESIKLGAVLGDWSQQDLFLGITPANLILGIASLLLVSLLLQLVRLLILKYLARSKNNGALRYWRYGIASAAWNAFSIGFLVTAIYLFISPIVPHLPLNGRIATSAIASKLAQMGYYLSFFVFLFQVVRLVENWLKGCAKRTPAQWYYPAFPVLGRALYYNLVLLAVNTLNYLLNLPDPLRSLTFRLISIAGIIINTLLAIQIVFALESMTAVRAKIGQYDDYRQRRILTRVRVFRQLAIFVIFLIACATILMDFEPVRQLGAGLLASAGVAGVIVGLAAQKSLSTIIAGLQIAITEPMKIGDMVLVEGEYGEIEEISLTYVVLKAWDQRRLILPITYFIDKPFQNWTRNSSDLIGTVFLYLDHTIDLDELRGETQRVLETAPLWDRRVCNLQVTDFKVNCIEIRILVSAATAVKVWDLRCDLREKLLTFLRTRHADALPKLRATLDANGTELVAKRTTREMAL